MKIDFNPYTLLSQLAQELSPEEIVAYFIGYYGVTPILEALKTAYTQQPKPLPVPEIPDLGAILTTKGNNITTKESINIPSGFLPAGNGDSLVKLNIPLEVTPTIPTQGQAS